MMSSGTHTLLPPHVLPSSACLLISWGGGRKLPPFLPKRCLSIFALSPSRSSNPPMHVVCADCEFDRFCEREAQREKNQTICSIRQPTQPHVWTLDHLHQLSPFSSSSRGHLCSRVENTLFTTKAEKKSFSFEEQKAARAFKVYLHGDEGVSAFSALIDQFAGEISKGYPQRSPMWGIQTANGCLIVLYDWI